MFKNVFSLEVGEIFKEQLCILVEIKDIITKNIYKAKK